MLNINDGKPIGMVSSGKNSGEIIFISDDDDLKNGYKTINLKDDKLIPLLDTDQRQVYYIAGPAGSGKSTYTMMLATCYKKIFPKRDIYIFSRTDSRKDPAYAKLKPMQVDINEGLLTQPIDIEKDIKKGSLIIFDDCNTIGDAALKKAVNALIVDILEVGRKLEIWTIITNHLVNPSEKALGRVILNEMQVLTVFPKSGSAHQIKYCLKNYFGLSNKQIQEIFDLKTRWVTIFKNYPMCVMHEHGAYLL